MYCFVNTKPVLAGKVQGGLTNYTVPLDSPVHGLLNLGLGRQKKKKKATNAILYQIHVLITATVTPRFLVEAEKLF